MKFSGMVHKRHGRGRALGFPTANLDAPKNLADGLYVGYADSKPALIFIGANETFGEDLRQAEVYILDFQGDLYDRTIAVETLERIRDVIKFDSTAALITQMKLDERQAREFFNLPR